MASKLGGLDLEANLPAALRDCGYVTGAVGKWHLASGEGSNFRSTYAEQRQTVLDASFDYAEAVYATNLEPRSWDFSHNLEWLAEKGLEFLAETELSAPHFLYWNPTCPHDPAVRASLLDPTVVYDARSTPAGWLAAPPDTSRFCARCGMPARAHVWEVAQAVSRHDSVAAVVWVDFALGTLLEYLDASGTKAAETYVIVTSDHGVAKDAITQSGFHTVLYVRGPGIRPRGSSDALVSHVDLAPTIIHFAGGLVADFLTDGTSWAGLATANETNNEARRTSVALEALFDLAVLWVNEEENSALYKMVQAGQGSLEREGGAEENQMYLLPDETDNIYEAMRDTAVFATLRGLLDDHRTKTYQAVVAQGDLTHECAPTPQPTTTTTTTPTPPEPTAKPTPGTTTPTLIVDPTLEPSAAVPAPVPTTLSTDQASGPKPSQTPEYVEVMSPVPVRAPSWASSAPPTDHVDDAPRRCSLIEPAILLALVSVYLSC